MAEDKKFLPPKHLIIDNYEYSFKESLKNNKYSYRCKYRVKCKITININESEIKKFRK